MSSNRTRARRGRYEEDGYQEAYRRGYEADGFNVNWGNQLLWALKRSDIGMIQFIIGYHLKDLSKDDILNAMQAAASIQQQYGQYMGYNVINDLLSDALRTLEKTSQSADGYNRADGQQNPWKYN
jgi:hypothetical protein